MVAYRGQKLQQSPVYWLLKIFIYLFNSLGLSCSTQDLQSVAACGIWFPDQRSDPAPLHRERGDLSTGPQGKSLHYTDFWQTAWREGPSWWLTMWRQSHPGEEVCRSISRTLIQSDRSGLGWQITTSTETLEKCNKCSYTRQCAMQSFQAYTCAGEWPATQVWKDCHVAVRVWHS